MIFNVYVKSVHCRAYNVNTDISKISIYTTYTTSLPQLEKFTHGPNNYKDTKP